MSSITPALAELGTAQPQLILICLIKLKPIEGTIRIGRNFFGVFLAISDGISVLLKWFVNFFVETPEHKISAEFSLSKSMNAFYFLY